MDTAEIKQKLYKHLAKQSFHPCHEVEIPCEHSYGILGRCDTVLYHKPSGRKAIFRFYEIKISVSDFHSKNGHNFYGNYNYYVLPQEIYDKVKHEIPKNIGCLIADNGFHCIKNAKKQELKCDYDKLLDRLITALSRGNCRNELGYVKYR